MDMTAIMQAIAACAPLVHPDTARALIAVESGFNAHAIGVVGGVLERQPGSRSEALATASKLQADGWDFSVGLAQINQRNFGRLGLSAATAFEPCENLRAMQAVLVECHSRAPSGRTSSRALGEALSCYYSGNFATGFRHGYVQRVAKAARSQANAREQSAEEADRVVHPSGRAPS